MTRFVLAIAAILTLAACGDPLVDGDYRGEPLIEVSGTIRVQDELTAAEADAVRVALMWLGAQQQDSIAQGRSESAFPARYNLKVFKRPPNRAMQTFEDRQGLYAMARIVLYVDADGNDRLDVTDRIVGASPDEILTYFTSSEGTSLVEGSLRTGYQVMKLISCEERLSNKTMLRPAASESDVDLTLESGIAKTLTDLDCDQVSDDLCYDLFLQLQESPNDAELLQLYRERCEVEFEPTFNNGDGTVNDPDNTDCTSQTGDEGCTEPDPNQPDGTEEAVEQCSTLLMGAVGTLHVSQRESYWLFRQCAGESDPCRDVQWSGTDDGWMVYQACIFERIPTHFDAWCAEAARLADENVDGDNDRFWITEYDRAGCAENF